MGADIQVIEIRPGQIAGEERTMKRVATVVYALQAVSFFMVGITFLIGLMVNYVNQSAARNTWLQSHFRWQIRTFWFGLMWALLGIPITFITFGVGTYVVYMALLVWLIYRIAKGWLRLNDGKEMYVNSRSPWAA